jgi:hypothetical protein
MVPFQKERILVGTYNKLNIKKFGLCKILKKRDSKNPYEVDFPSRINFYHVFNISHLKKYHEGGIEDGMIKNSAKLQHLL